MALLEYLDGERGKEIKVLSPDVDDDVIPVDYMFRSFDDMPKVEQEALKLARGKILDAGAGAGCHSLWLQEQGLDVTAVDTSAGNVEAMKRQGLKNVRQDNIWEMKEEQFDTILLLMNGMGFAGEIQYLPKFIRHLSNLLKPGGQIVFDSTDLIYLFLDDEGGAWINLNDKYIGEITYVMEYKGIESEPFPWLFVDYELVEQAAEMASMHAEKLLSMETYAYLARLTKK
jgi:SAM-dependent methyltransferase